MLKRQLLGYTKKCTVVILLGDKMKQIMINSGVKARITVIPNGINVADREIGLRDIKKIRNELRIKKGSLVLLYVGRLSVEKNIGFLLRAILPFLKQDIVLFS